MLSALVHDVQNSLGELFFASSGRDDLCRAAEADCCQKGWRVRKICGVWEKWCKNKKKLHRERYLTPDFWRLSASDSSTGRAVQPPDKDVLFNWSKFFLFLYFLSGYRLVLWAEMLWWKTFIAPYSCHYHTVIQLLASHGSHHCVNEWWIL